MTALKKAFYFLLLLFLSACSSESNVLPTLVVIPTEAAVLSSPAPSQAKETSQNQIPELVTEEAALTPELFATSEELRFRNEAGDLYVVVSSMQEGDAIPALPEAPTGEVWLVLTATLANLTGNPILVDETSLSLIDQEYNRYAPVHPEEFLRPSLVGIELDGVIPILGVVRFLVPEDAIPYLLEWCPQSPCDEALQSRLP